MVLDNLVSGAREVLAFTEEGERGVGYVPENPVASQVVRLYLMSNASLGLTDKLGNQFQFDPFGELTDMAFSPDPNHQVHFEYASGFIDAFDAAPYVVCPADRERVQFRGLRIPQRVKVTSSIDGSSEVLAFSDQGRIAGYVPDSERTSRYRLAALRTDTGVQLVDRFGNEARFNPNWSFEGLLLSGQSGKIVRSVCSAGHKVTFRYVLDPSGKLVISNAALAENHPLAEASQVMRYEHDDHGRLCRVTRCKRRSASSRIDGSVDANEGLGSRNANDKTTRAANWKADWPAT